MDYSFRGPFNDVLLSRISRTIDALGMQGKVAVAMDTRPSSPALYNLITSHLLQNGNEVHSLGVAPTPVLSFYTKHANCLGIMITASHNPMDDNGIKMFFRGAEAQGITPHPSSPAPSHKLFTIDAYLLYIQNALAQVDTSTIKSRKPKVLIDCINGTAANYTPFILRSAGAHVVTVNAELSHPFSREPEPTENALAYLVDMVRELDADFAVAHDPDADRCRIVTRDGVMNQDVQLLNMADALCSEGDTFVTTVEASQLVSDILKTKGVSVEITPVGSNFIARALQKRGRFGGEPCGEYVYPHFLLTADGVMTALQFTKLYCDRGFTNYKPYSTIRGKVEVHDKDKSMSMIRAKLAGEHGVKMLSTLDGLLFEYNNARVLIRKSNTQNIVRITCEHKDEESARSVYSRVMKIVEGIKV